MMRQNPSSCSDTVQSRPWFAFYDEGVPHDVVVPDSPLTELLDTAAATFPKQVAVTFQNLDITYAELKDKAETLAASLRARGVCPGDRVAVMLPNLPQTFIAFWGVLKAGATVVMTNPLYMESELTHLVTDSGARHMILLDIFWPKIAALRERLGLEVCYVTRQVLNSESFMKRDMLAMSHVPLMRLFTPLPLPDSLMVAPIPVFSL